MPDSATALRVMITWSAEQPLLPGIDSPDEPPEDPELHLETADITAQEAARRVVEALERAGRLAVGVSPGSDPRR